MAAGALLFRPMAAALKGPRVCLSDLRANR